MVFIVFLRHLTIGSFLIATSFTTETVFQADGVCVSDYDDDECCELIVRKESRFYVMDQKLISHFELNMDDNNYFQFLGCAELDNKPPRELLFECKIQDTLWLYIYSGSDLIRREKTISGKSRHPPQDWDGWLTQFKLADLNGDRISDLIFLVNTSFDLQPRGLWVYDFANRMELWRKWIGGSPRNVHVVDIDRDGNDDIIISTTAVCNGSTAGGIDDTCSYVLVLNAGGELVWQYRIGGRFTDAISWAGNLDGEPGYEIVLAECEGTADKKTPNRILILNARDGTLKKYIAAGEKFMGLVVADLNRDGKNELITGNTDGVVRIYNDQLDLIMQSNFQIRNQIMEAADFNGDGAMEIILRVSESRMVLLDEHLQVCDEYESRNGERIEVSVLSENHQKKILVSTGEKAPFSFTLLSVAGPGFVGKVVRSVSPVYYVLLFVAGAVIVWLVVFIMITRRKLIEQETQSSRIDEWSGLAQRLAHEIKNPLSTITLTLQRVHDISKKKFGRNAGVLDSYTNSILEEVDRLKQTTNKFMRVLSLGKPYKKPCDISGLLNAALGKYASSLPDSIKISKQVPVVPNNLHCDENQMITVFGNIVENALEALGGKGRLTISVIPMERIIKRKIKRYVEIRFEDTGRGFTKKQLASAFTPFQSAKPQGTGLGLVIARRIIQEHGGEMRIESKEGIGTVVIIMMPIDE